ncbi:HNH endonuclease [Candidatus Poriferisodalis sp.]|uniref:HNH endonuclease n=1 Tax=Candidatus Poriferisodalis sp. TaxID=3101277 RepID=UPI003B0206C9
MRRYETKGEYFARYLLDHYLGGREPQLWSGVGDALLASARAEDWIDAFREMASLQLCRRLIGAGAVLLTRYGLEASEREMKQMVVDTMVVHYRAAGNVYERLVPAVKSSLATINNSLRKELRAFARREMPRCYLCGVNMDFEEEGHLSFTLDHVWPRAYGGDSSFDNLLGACQSCNNHKSDTPSWAMYPVQALVAGFEIESTEVLQKDIRFAVQARAATMLARDSDVSLREAFVQLGRPGPPSIRNTSTAVDVFNLQFANP